jgi:diphosphomevalonate decarboxylase
MVNNCSGGFNNFKLPTITLPTFSGKVCEWQHFHDTFQALIVDNKQLFDIQRYHYLISSLQGEAKSLIQNLPVTTENFHVAWQLVTDRYSNKKLIAMMHIKQLCQLSLVSKGNSGNLSLLIILTPIGMHYKHYR